MYVTMHELKDYAVVRPATGLHALTGAVSASAGADTKGKFDELVEEHGVRLLIDPAALMHVLGTKMDYIDEPLK
jgi:Fe-S cluster assembly iron-binding protein IscA